MNDIVTKIILTALNVAEQMTRLPFQILYFLWTGLREWCGDLAACFDASDEPADGDEPATEKHNIGFHRQ